MRSSVCHARRSNLRGERAQTLPEHPVEGRERVDHVGEGLERRAQFDRQHELTQDLARARAHERRADQNPALAVGDELERAPVKVMDVPSRGLGGIGDGHGDVDALRARGGLAVWSARASIPRRRRAMI